MPPVLPLSDAELREVLKRLYDLGSAWSEVDALRSGIRQVDQLTIREREIHQRELDNEKRATELMERDRDQIARERDFYKAKAEIINKSPGLGCVLKKIFTLGLARCG